MPHRLMGWKRQPKDHRDWQFISPRRIVAALAPKVDLSPNMGQYLDQSTEGSCGPNSAAELIEFDQKMEGISVVLPSRNFIYWNTRSLMGTTSQDSGVDNRMLLKALAQYGFCPESMWAYDTSRFTVKPSQACYTAALANRIASYAAVQQTLDQMKGCVAQGRPFIFGFDCFNGIMSEQAAVTGIIPDPQPGETPIGGHDMSLCGYDDGGFGKIPGGAFKLRQHWVNDDGSPWGDHGYGYVSYKFALSAHASDFWVINAVPGGAPAPVPPPIPVPTPTPTPVPVPTPTPIPIPPGPGRQQILSVIDTEFTRLEHLNPSYSNLLQQLNADLDNVIKQHFPATMDLSTAAFRFQ